MIVDPRATAVAAIQPIYTAYPHIGPVLPALGYSPAQLDALRLTINAAQADVVVAATPCDLGALIAIDKPVVRVRYEFAEVGELKLSDLVQEFLLRSMGVSAIKTPAIAGVLRNGLNAAGGLG